ncbi:MAG: M4 family metallopeptidase [Bacteroidales bacterium]|nr:M4 family metallopeptidase [Bacteroidales bacterium]
MKTVIFAILTASEFKTLLNGQLLKKQLTILILLMMICVMSFGQTSASLSISDIRKNLSGKANSAKFSAAEFDSAFVFNNLNGILNLSEFDSFNTKRIRFDDKYQTKTIRLHQLHKGIKIDRSEIILHFDKSNRLKSLNGIWFESLDLPTQTDLKESDVLSIAFSGIDTSMLFYKDHKFLNEHKMNVEKFIPKPELMYYWDGESNGFILSWEVSLHFTAADNYKIFIDANSGLIIKKVLLDIDCNTGSVSTAWYGTKTIWTYYSGGLYHLIDDCSTTQNYDNYTYDCQQQNYLSAGQEIYSSSDNNWNLSPNEIVGGTLHWCMDQYEQYLRNEHSRDSWDDSNADWLGFANCSINGSSQNAVFNSNGFAAFGFGASTSSPTDDFVTLDIVAHEFTHGINSSEANLQYQSESGALNESFSDIFGEICEEYVLGNTDWLCGDDLSGMGPLRSLSDPGSISDYGGPMPNCYQGPNWYSGSSDFGGVHHNSSVQNFMFYLLCEGGNGENDCGDSYSVNGIGISNASEIAYLVLVDYISSYSDFADARISWLDAVSEAFPGNSSYYQSVEDAWCAVGVGNSCSGGGQPPVANFSGTPTSGNSPLNVSFTNLSTNSPTSCNWNFGDGSTSTLQNPSHNYASAGYFTVTLTVTNQYGTDSEIKYNYIHVTEAGLPPVANFSGNPTSGNSPLIVTFTNQSTGSPTSWLWNFGDGSSSTLQNPQHTYTTTGYKTVTMIATNQYGSDTETKTNYIYVSPAGQPPVADFTGTPTNGNSPLTVIFTNQSTGSPTSWLWNFGDGSSSTLQNPQHNYLSPGYFTVRLIVTNQYGTSSEVKNNFINIYNEATITTFATSFFINDNADFQGIYYDIVQSSFDSSFVTLGNYNFSSQNTGGIIYSKISKNGTVVWTKTIENLETSNWLKILRSQNGYLLCFYYDNYSMIMEIDENGQRLFSKRLNLTFNKFCTTSTGYVGICQTSNGIGLLKINFSGNPVWQKYYTYSTYANTLLGIKDLIVDNSGNLIVYGYILDGNSGNNSIDGFIIKVGPNGDLNWSRKYSGNLNNSDNITSLVITDNDDIIVGIATNDNLGHFSNGYILKLNSLGIVTDCKQLPISFEPIIFGQEVNEFYAYLQDGEFFNIVSMDSEFNITEQKTFKDIFAYSIKQTFDNRFVLVGFNSLDLEGASENMLSIYKVSFNDFSCADADLLNVNISGSSFSSNPLTASSSSSWNCTASDYLIGIDNIILSDSSLCPECMNPISNFTASKTSGTCPLVVDFIDFSETSGSASWLWTIYTGDETPIISTQTNPSGILFENSGSFLVSLEVTDECGSNIKSVQDYITVTCPNDTDEKVGTKRIFEIFPNPTTNFITIKAKDLTEEFYNISILNVMGDLIKQTYFTVSDNRREMTFDVSDLPLGVYLFSIKSSNFVQTFKIIKQ